MQKIILSIPFQSRNQFQADLKEIIDLGYKIPLIEIRWDYYLENITQDLANWVNKSVHSLEMKTIFTYHHKNMMEILPILTNLISFMPDYIDLNVDIIASKLRDLAEYATKMGINIVYSYHNYTETPPFQFISDMYHFFIQMLPKITSKTGHILKMVFTAKKTQDIDTILEFCNQYGTQGIPLITFCMGEIGIKSRIQSIQNGAAFTYAYLREPTAPGQVQIQKFQ